MAISIEQKQNKRLPRARLFYERAVLQDMLHNNKELNELIDWIYSKRATLSRTQLKEIFISFAVQLAAAGLADIQSVEAERDQLKEQLASAQAELSAARHHSKALREIINRGKPVNWDETINIAWEQLHAPEGARDQLRARLERLTEAITIALNYLDSATTGKQYDPSWAYPLELPMKEIRARAEQAFHWLKREIDEGDTATTIAVDQTRIRLERLEAQLQRLTTALDRYGMHEDDCNLENRPATHSPDCCCNFCENCSCGYLEAMEDALTTPASGDAGVNGVTADQYQISKEQLDNEINDHENYHRGDSGRGGDFEEGFINGLKYVRENLISPGEGGGK